MGKNRKNKSNDCEKLSAGKSRNIDKMEAPDTLLGAINPSYFDETIGKALGGISEVTCLGDIREEEEMDRLYAGKE